MDKLRKFFEENNARIGEGRDYETNPPIYYSSLSLAFYNYFLTFKDKKDIYHSVFNISDWRRESIAFSFSGANSNIMFSILNFHRFIELFLKDVLRRIDPFLVVKFHEKEVELFKFLKGKISADEIKTIEFSETLKRFKYAFEFYDKKSDTYRDFLQKYEFLIESNSIETFNYLTEWRNRIMHNGTTLPNLFAFEYLISQRLIPLINKIIFADKDKLNGYIPYFFETKTGIKVVDEILKVKFEYLDFSKKSKSKQLGLVLLKLGHLKEIGRASYNQNVYDRQNKSFSEMYYENPTGRMERFAKTEEVNENFYGINNCICCGARALVVYRKSLEIFFDGDRGFMSWFKCYNCDYSLKDNVGDPSLFGLSSKQLFANS